MPLYRVFSVVGRVSCRIAAAAAASAVALSLLLPSGVLADPGDDERALGMYFGEEPTAVTATRSASPVSEVAEDITVITSQDIAALAPRTLQDVLFTVTGVQIGRRGTPGISTTFYVNGASFAHVRVMIDGVTLNNGAEGFPELSLIPVSVIDRIEIIKGPGSAVWGSALGGVINIITKNPDQERPLAVAISAFGGEEAVRDIGAEASGGGQRGGYYLYAGHVGSGDMGPGSATDLRYGYGKATLLQGPKGGLTFAAGISEAFRGQGTSATDSLRLGYATLSGEWRPSVMQNVNLLLRGWEGKSGIDSSGGGNFMLAQGRESGLGASLTWSIRTDGNNVTFGGDFDRLNGSSHTFITGMDDVRRSRQADRWGIFVNDTLQLGPLSLIPGIRLDDTETNHSFVSPGAGVALTLTEGTVLRGYVGRGFSISGLIDNSTEKVFAYQVGVETSDIPYLWVRATAFRNRTSDVLGWDRSNDTIRKESHDIKGIDAELKTVPVFGFTAGVGVVVMEHWNRTGHEQGWGSPRNTVDLSLRYGEEGRFKAAVTARSQSWIAAGEDHAASDFIWSARASYLVYEHGTTRIEAFATIDNIFNGRQYPFDAWHNPGRWAGGGVRCGF